MKNKKLLLLLAVLLLVLLAGGSALYSRLSQSVRRDNLAADLTADPAANEGAQTLAAPDFTLQDGTGTAVSLSDYLGEKPIVLNFWASSCGPCRSEMPDFQAAYEAQGDEIQFLMVNVTDGSWDTLESAQSFLEESGYTFPVLFDTQSEGVSAYSVYGLPTTFFIDVDGNLVAQAQGAIDSATLEKGIGMIAP